MAYSASQINQLLTRPDGGNTCFHYSNWNKDNIAMPGYITSASAVDVQAHDMIYSIHPVDGGQQWYICREVVADVPILEHLGPARNTALPDFQYLTNEVQLVAWWYAQNYAPTNTGPAGPQGIQGEKGDKGDKGDTGSQGPAGISAPAPSISSGVSRTLGTAYTISATRPALVAYTVRLEATNPLVVGNSSAEAYLEYSTNGGTTWIPLSNGVNRKGVALTVSIQITDRNEQVLTGMIPANAQARIRSAVSGTATVTYVSGQETLL